MMKKGQRKNTKLNWREDLEKTRRQKKRADELAAKAVQKAEMLAERQKEAENVGIISIVRELELTPEELADF